MEDGHDILEPARPRGRPMRVVSRDLLLESVSAAVEATLSEFTGLPLAARLTLRRDVQRRFVALSLERARRVRGMTRDEALAEFERAHAALSEEHGATRKELARLEQRLAADRAEPAPEGPDDAALGRALARDLAELLAAPGERRTAIERVVARETARRELAIEQALAAERGKTDVLERRVTKMRSELATMERAMAVLERRAAVDDGIASIYKDVQGLSAAEPERETKKALMHQLFEANLALQRRAPSVG